MERKSPAELLREMHASGQDIREQSFRAIDEIPRLRATLDVGLLATLPISKAVGDYSPTNEDERTLQFLLVRLSNSVSAARELALLGLYQVALSVARDACATADLLEYFGKNKSRVQHWSESKPGDRIRGEFSPGSILKALEKDGPFSDYRREIYGLLSDNASHPSYSGNVLLGSRSDATSVHQGPFFDSAKLEMAIHVSNFPLYAVLGVLVDLLPALSPALKAHIAENNVELTRRTQEFAEQFGP